MLIHLRKAPVAAIIFIASLVSIGCGDTLDLGEVTGKVTKDGAPLSGFNISFVPNAGGRTSNGITNEQGEYQLWYTDSRGALKGEHKVFITNEGAAGPDDGEAPEDDEEVVKEESFSGTAVVEGGDNVINFEVTELQKQ